MTKIRQQARGLLKNIRLFRYFYSKLPFKFKKNYKFYSRTENLLKRNEYFSKEKQQQWQFEKLTEIINYAWNNIAGYRELWEKHDFHPHKLKTLDDIKLIPFVTKEILRNNIDKFTNKTLPNLEYVTTGGSTGIPFGFYQQEFNRMIEWAFIIKIWSRFYKDIKPDTKRVTLRGNQLNGIYTHDPLIGLVLSSYDLNITNIKEYIKQIEKYKYPIFHVYPSALFLMAKIMEENNLQLNHKFEAIMFGSEPLYDFQKELIQKKFNTKLCYWYGHTEQTILAGNCEKDDRLHFDPHYGITEIIDCELIGTSFWNYATPFIRYKTMDYAKFDDTNLCTCNRNFQLTAKIDGRLQDYIVNYNNELVTLTALIFAQHFYAFANIIQMQLHQKVVGEIIVKIIPTKDFSENDAGEIIQKMTSAANHKINVIIERVSKLELTTSGKTKFLEQKLNISNFI